MQFVDRVDITVKGGDGGHGVVAFRQEKFIPRGGPAGGDGGRGGSVKIRASKKLNTLVDLRYQKHYKAERGGDGGTNNKHGGNGKDLKLVVPVGTLVYETSTGKILADLLQDGQVCIASKGGQGGRGNASFATSTNQTPKFAEKGEPVDSIDITLELKLIADVGLIGFPNVGKSTLISVISAAKPKIADYPFTTLIPNLGVVKVGDNSFVVADMPGLIEGAHTGAGLGHQFLRHIERTRILVHLVDVSGFTGRDIITDFDKINDELNLHSEKLASLQQIVALNKIDIAQSPEIVETLKKTLTDRGFEVYEISAVTGAGVQPLLYRIAERLEELPKEIDEIEDIVRFTVEPEERGWQIHRNDAGAYVVESSSIVKLIKRVDINNEYALRRLHRLFEKMGLIDDIRKHGAVDGDSVIIDNIEFEFSDEM